MPLTPQDVQNKVFSASPRMQEGLRRGRGRRLPRRGRGRAHPAAHRERGPAQPAQPGSDHRGRRAGRRSRPLSRRWQPVRPGRAGGRRCAGRCRCRGRAAGGGGPAHPADGAAYGRLRRRRGQGRGRQAGRRRDGEGQPSSSATPRSGTRRSWASSTRSGSPSRPRSRSSARSSASTAPGSRPTSRPSCVTWTAARRLSAAAPAGTAAPAASPPAAGAGLRSGVGRGIGGVPGWAARLRPDRRRQPGYAPRPAGATRSPSTGRRGPPRQAGFETDRRGPGADRHRDRAASAAARPGASPTIDLLADLPWRTRWCSRARSWSAWALLLLLVGVFGSWHWKAAIWLSVLCSLGRLRAGGDLGQAASRRVPRRAGRRTLRRRRRCRRGLEDRGRRRDGSRQRVRRGRSRQPAKPPASPRRPAPKPRFSGLGKPKPASAAGRHQAAAAPAHQRAGHAGAGQQRTHRADAPADADRQARPHAGSAAVVASGHAADDPGGRAARARFPGAPTGRPGRAGDPGAQPLPPAGLPLRHGRATTPIMTTVGCRQGVQRHAVRSLPALDVRPCGRRGTGRAGAAGAS